MARAAVIAGFAIVLAIFQVDSCMAAPPQPKSSKPEVACDNANRRVQPTQYIAVLEVDNLQKVSIYRNNSQETVLRGKIAIRVKTADEKLYQIINGPPPAHNSFVARCDDVNVGGEVDIVFAPKNPTFENADELLRRILRRSGGSKDVLFRAWPEAFRNWPSGTAKDIWTLIDAYFSDTLDIDLFEGFAEPVGIHVLNFTGQGIHKTFTWVPPGATEAMLQSWGMRGSNQPPPPPKQAATKNPSAANPKAGSKSSSTHVQNAGTPPAAVEIKQDTTFALSFRDKQWLDVHLDEADRVQTFGFCSKDIERRDDGSYVLRCAPASDGRIPVRIAGFNDIYLSAKETNVDDRLQVLGFRAYYPPSWGRASNNAVEISPGLLSDVLKREVPLDQGITGVTDCRAGATITVAAVVNQTVLFPAPPCRRYDLVFEQGLFGSSSTVQSGCYAGSATPVPIHGGQVTCWYNPQKQSSIELKFHLLPGFGAISASVPQQSLQQSVTVTFASLADKLRPIWPYGRGSPVDDYTDKREAPHYQALTVQYFQNGDEPCGPPQTTAQLQLPTLAAAACGSVPIKAKIKFGQTQANVQGAPPAEAFLPEFDDPVTIRDITGGNRTKPLDDIKRALRVGFNQEKGRDYDKRFGAGNNNKMFPGAYVFNGDCRDKPRSNDPLVKFTEQGQSTKLKWPVSGMVFDGNYTAVTRCAAGTVEKPAQGEPFFTFDLELARAIGPRRAIIIADNNESFQGGGFRPTLQESLRSLIDVLSAAYKEQKMLYPISVYFFDGQNELRPLFTGEDAAFKPDDTKRKIGGGQIDQSAAKTPDLTMIARRPELDGKKLARVLVIMDGSDVTRPNVSEMNLVAGNLTNGSEPGVSFYITSNMCDEWQANIKHGFRCTPLLGDLPSRREKLKKAFGELLNPS